MMKKLSHIGIAVRDLRTSVEIFAKLFGRPPAGSENVADQKVNIAFFHLPNLSVELTEPASADSVIARFIEKRGEGIHHLSFEVDDIDAEIQRLKAAGFQLIDEKPRKGADGCLVAFLHPKSTNGVLIELSQKASISL